MEFLNFLNENNKDKCLQAIKYNIKNNIPLVESVFRPGSDMFIAYFQYLKENINNVNNISNINDKDSIEIINLGLGTVGLYENHQVPLYLPFIDESDINNNDNDKEKIELNKPKRGGSKKFYVYVKDPTTGNIKKVSFGQPGMSAKINNPKAAKAFAARHNCQDKTDPTTPGYWSCRLPKYAKLLGLTGGGDYYW